MVRKFACTLVVLCACGGGASSGVLPDGGAEVDLDAGTPGPLPTSYTFSTSRGTLTGSEAFAIDSAQSIFTSDAGDYLGFEVSDTGQCLPADVDGGAYVSPMGTTHVMSGFVRSLQHLPMSAGTYPIGMSSDDEVQAYLDLTEYARDGGGSTTYLATDGTLTVTPSDGGHLDFTLHVHLGDAVDQQELPFQGSFSADTCTP